MNRREFISLAVGMVTGSMIKPIEPIVRIPVRPRVAPTLTPIASPSLMGEMMGKDAFSSFVAGFQCPPVKLFVVDAQGRPIDFSEWEFIGSEPNPEWTHISIVPTNEDV